MNLYYTPEAREFAASHRGCRYHDAHGNEKIRLTGRPRDAPPSLYRAIHEFTDAPAPYSYPMPDYYAHEPLHAVCFGEKAI